MLSSFYQENIFRDKVFALARSVGTFQLKHFRQGVTVVSKAQNDLVSFVDEESENLLREGLSQINPQVRFWGEESGRSSSLDCEYEWIVDPLDGTTNYLHGLEQFSISIALTENGRPVFGLIYQPCTGRSFGAVRDDGIFLDNKIHALIPRESALSEALVGTGFPYRSPDLYDAFLGTCGELFTACRDLRRMGSAALDLSYLGVGFFQAFWESDLQPYDVAAAMVILAEAGVLCTNEHGQAYDFHKDRILVAAKPEIHCEFLAIIARNYKE